MLVKVFFIWHKINWGDFIYKLSKENKTLYFLSRLIPTWTCIKIASDLNINGSVIENLFLTSTVLIGTYSLFKSNKKDSMPLNRIKH